MRHGLCALYLEINFKYYAESDGAGDPVKPVSDVKDKPLVRGVVAGANSRRVNSKL